jgi:DNA end-binding protein Ku
VIRTRQHLAMLYPGENHLILNTLRYRNEIRPAEDIDVPKDLHAAKVQANEMKMAERLIDDMTMKWKPDEYHDTYRDDLMKMIEEKAAGHVKEAPKSKRAPREAEVIDFASLLEKSLAARKRAGAAGEEETPRRTPHRRPAAKTRRKAAAPRAANHHRRAA